MSFPTIKLTKTNSLIFILVITAVIVLDSMIVDFATYSGATTKTWINVTIFGIFSMIYVGGSVFLLSSIWKSDLRDSSQSLPLINLSFFRILISVVLISTIIILTVINTQMLFTNKYSLNLLSIQTYIVFISALVFLTLLVYSFVRWLSSSKRNYVIILYTISFFLIVCNLAISLVYIQSFLTGFSAALPDVRPYPISRYVTDIAGSAFSSSLSIVADALSLSSFLMMWIATAILLSQYRHRMGNLKYFSIMSVPLVYYIFPFQGYFGDLLFPLLIASPVALSMVYVLFFSATKQVGAFLFGLSFLTASSIVHDERIRRSLLISSIGMTVLFASQENSPLQYHAYPPFGLITILFLPLGPYLLYEGILTAAKKISRDAALRIDFYRSAESQLSLLKDIGVSEMEKEFESKVKFASKHITPSHDTSVQFESMEEAEIKETLRDVLNELYYSKSKGKEVNS
jgi:hypothetical protein